MGKEGYQEMGRKGGAAAGLSSTGEEAETRETTLAAQDTGPEPNKEKIKEILASNLDPAEKLRLIVEEQKLVDKENVREAVVMLTPEEREELDRRARAGEVVVLGGTGGKSLEAQIHLAEGKRQNVLFFLEACTFSRSFPHYPIAPGCAI
jgi:hypothetical protein